MQDIRIADDSEYFYCWPNAGTWNVTAGIDCGKCIPDSEVTHIKMSDNWLENDGENVEELLVEHNVPIVGTIFPSNIIEKEYAEYIKIIDRNSFKTSNVVNKQYKPNKGFKIRSYTSKRK